MARFLSLCDTYDEGAAVGFDDIVRNHGEFADLHDPLDLPIIGLLNKAGVQNTRVMKNAAGWDMTFATNHLAPKDNRR
jgi:NAD(P)-dependent dehydrogenase (short-subunit alcohol dehydrogenase family)